ncbi:IclR family transcriptional regulator [Streptomyces europaeiscabiei]|uniref:IclR family transcriptional regulator n=1 Tax=Streptomyces europaeiscabiei TaxID=146819 RepID=A0ABU4NSW1_9ACTN|nr:IclR family transcriptional regulator [Streptomyces europaeiscabiei]MDX3548331.1 IclR family transcriptional regulator [Streptomyces europaeiscabiei]MDX3558891.1 IclR family transcriptional regulator [Streptomyces europaeiscabiei]MDX3671914.1 IclR family transcriptional regulator [Streptomyces europaeiscabiei]MDX3705834.1 IclR family transcriptional regulator [Streptomyces europaeiscabiei]MDX3784612.1 IclR family transcriptional regulator [Streptomyces europaeiscabiei]
MKSVTRSLRILEAVAQHQPVTVGELTKIFGLPKSTVQRTLVTLAEAGWLRANRKDTTRWEIGARVLAVRPAALQGSSLLTAAREPMVRLRDALNETIHLSVPDALQCMVVVDRVDSDHPVRTFHTIGDTSPLHATAVGRAVLAHLPKQDVEELIAQGLERFTDTTPADPEELRAELDRIRTDGYAVNRNQYRPGVCAIAAPVLDEAGAPLASVAVSMPDSRFDAERLPEWSRMVAETAAEITGRRRG